MFLRDAGEGDAGEGDAGEGDAGEGDAGEGGAGGQLPLFPFDRMCKGARLPFSFKYP